MPPKHLLLTGYRGCGKSAVGNRLSQSLSLDLIDTDLAIESTAGKTIAEIFAESGQEGFRILESNQIASLVLLTQPTIISLGGGAILRPENRQRIRGLGNTVWLQATPDTIHDRVANDSSTQTRRPKLSQLGDLDEIRSILEVRTPLYQEVADLVVSTDGRTTDEVAHIVAQWYRSLPRAKGDGVLYGTR
jgi:shikimate kinase